MRAVVMAVLAFFALCFLNAEAYAAPALQLKPNSGPPGAKVTVTGSGYGAGDGIDILFDGTNIGSAKADATGAFTVEVTIPTDAAAGKHVVSGSDTVTLNFATKNFTVETTWRQFHGDDAEHTGVNEHENTIDATNAASLALKWKRNIGSNGTTVTPVVGDGAVWVGGLDGKLYAFDELTGKPLPGYPVQVGNFDNFGRGAPVVTPQGVFIGGEQGWLYGFDPRTGFPLPNYPIQLSSYFFGSLSYVSGNLYVGTFDGKLAAFNASTGAPLAHYPIQLDGGLYGSLTTDGIGHGFIGTSAGSLFAINLPSGTTAWNFTAGSVITSTVAYSLGQLFFGADSGDLFGLDATTGSLLPHFPYLTGGSIGGSPAVYDNEVCFGSFDMHIGCIDRTTAKRLSRMAVRAESWGSFEIANGLLLANDLQTLYVITLSTYAKLWSHALAFGETSSPVMANGIIYTASTDGYLRAYAPPPPPQHAAGQ